MLTDREVYYKYFLSVCGLTFQFLNNIYVRIVVSNFDGFQFVMFFLYGSCFFVFYPSNLCLSQSQRFAPIFPFRSFMFVCFCFSFIIQIYILL